MRFVVDNLGPVRHAELDVRPLMVVIGKNNVGKTWLAYSMAMAWRHAAATDGQAKRAVAILDSLNEPARLVELLQAEMDERALTPEVIQATFAAYHAQVSDVKVSVHFDQSDAVASASYIHERKQTALDRLRAAGLVTEAQADSVNNDQQSALSLMSAMALPRALFSVPIVFPAERVALVQTYRMLSNRRFMVMRDRLRYGRVASDESRRAETLARELGEVRFPQPVEDFLDFLNEVETARPEHDRPTAAATIADLLESNLNNGQRLDWAATSLGGRELVLTLPSGEKVDLHLAASSIKQLAPIILYLRHVAGERSFIIIDEPEMNLHPEAQARFVEVMALLVQAGHQVLLTTHSPYILAHLNNIIAGSAKPEVREKQADELYLKNPGAFLRPDQVGAWELDLDGLKPLYEEGWGIRYTTLSDPAEEISRRYYAIRAMDDDGEPG